MLFALCSWLQPRIQMSFLIHPAVLRMKTAIRKWKRTNGGADERTVRDKSQPLLRPKGSCQCISKSKIYVHHLRAHTPISYLGLSPL